MNIFGLTGCAKDITNSLGLLSAKMHTNGKNLAVILDSAFKLDKQINFSSSELLQSITI